MKLECSDVLLMTFEKISVYDGSGWDRYFPYTHLFFVVINGKNGSRSLLTIVRLYQYVLLLSLNDRTRVGRISLGGTS